MKLSEKNEKIMNAIGQASPKNSSVTMVTKETGFKAHVVYSALRDLYELKFASRTDQDAVYLLAAGRLYLNNA